MKSPKASRSCLGREGDGIRLDDHKVSRRHARLWAEQGNWYIQDCESRHGTFHNQNRVKDRAALKDGDRVQIGRTVMVLARMPAEHVERAERFALLGHSPEHAEADAQFDVRSGTADAADIRRQRTATIFKGTAAAAAIIGIIGVNVFFYDTVLNALNEKTGHLERQITAAQTTNNESNQALLAQLRGRKIADSPSNTALQAVLAAVREQHQESIKQLETIQQSIARAPQHNRPLLEAVLAQAKAQQDQAQELADLRTTIEQQQTQTTPFLERLAGMRDTAEANQQALAKLSKQLQAAAPAAEAPDSPDIAALSDALAKREYATARKLDVVLDRLERQDRLQQSLTQLQGQVQQLASAQQATTDQDTVSQEAEKATADTLQQILQTVQANHAAAQQVAKLEELITALPEQQRTQLAASMEQVRQAVAAQSKQTGQQLAKITASIQQRPTQEQLAAQLEAVGQAQTEQTAAMGDLILAQFGPQSNLTENLAQLHQMIEAQPKQTQQQIQSALRAWINRPIAPRRTARRQLIKKPCLQAIAELRQAMPSNITPLMEQVLAAVRSQAEARNASNSDAHVDQDEMVAQVLRRLRSGLGEDLRKAVREEVKHTLRSADEGLGAAYAFAGSKEAGETRENQAEHKNGMTAGPSVKPLTKTQMAYKLAFETGQPITIGGGVVNPESGEVSEGRTLDPAAAKAAGIQTWREWYHMDDLAEQARLHRQAKLHRIQQQEEEQLINLPEPYRAPAYASSAEEE